MKILILTLTALLTITSAFAKKPKYDRWGMPTGPEAYQERSINENPAHFALTLEDKLSQIQDAYIRAETLTLPKYNSISCLEVFIAARNAAIAKAHEFGFRTIEYRGAVPRSYHTIVRGTYDLPPVVIKLR
jgi:predicted lipid-binding transport protein (Tim44 family)